jgi:two-component system LytT family sensor kinase
VNTARATLRHPSPLLRGGALALAVWAGFFGLQSAMSAALSPGAAGSRLAIVQEDLVLAVLWAGLTVGAAVWHRYARSIAPNLAALIALHVPVLFIITMIDTEVSRMISVHILGSTRLAPFAASVVFYADFDVVSYLAVVAVTEALLVRGALVERQRLAKRLEASLSRARLDYLETQLQPHFLFNSLGAVSELAYDAPATASRVLHQLTAIFRTALARKGDEVTLGEEIVGIEPYLDIQRIRFADWLTIDYHVDDAAVDCLLPRFVLQPLVENAIRHGLSGRIAAGTIGISASVDAGSLLVRVIDNGVGLESAPSSSGRGIGLSNVRTRLSILYGDDDRLRLYGNATGGAVAELRIPARRRGAATDEAEAAEHDAIVSIGRSDLPVLQLPSFLQRRWLGIAFMWLVCGLLWAQQSYMYLRLRDRLGSSSWLEIAFTDMVSAMLWALLTPVILAFATRFPIRRTRLWARITIYFAAGAAATFIHLVALQRIAMPEAPLSSPAWGLSTIVGFLIFCVIAVAGHRQLLVQWLRDREAAAEALSAELAAAQDRAVKLQGIPQVLMQSLDGIAETVRRDPALTERQLTRLADYLRLALEATDARGMTPERERALDAAVGALRDSGAFPSELTLTA